MDFLQTLLVYMTTMFTLAVGNTAPPTETPEPTSVPTPAIVEGVEASATSRTRIVAASPSPTPTVSVTPQPVPTITPNKAYHNLQQGDRGPEVKALQEKLIELRYLPEGAADGAYGNQTRRAVMFFQYYNGLSKDGIAGRATQTNLFENPAVQPMPENTAVTPTPIAAAVVTPIRKNESIQSGQNEKTDEPDENEPDEDEPDEDEPDEDESQELEAAEPTEELTPEPAAEPEEIDGNIVLNDNGIPVSWVGLRDGVMVVCYPRILRSGDRFWASLEELSKGNGWTMTEDGGHIILEAEGNTLVITVADSGKPEIMVNGLETELNDNDILLNGDEVFIDLNLLAKSMNGTAEWDEDEKTLMLRIPHKDAIGAEG